MNDEEMRKLVAHEVERVFSKRGWKSYAQAELATGLPIGTLQRLRKGMGKADTIIRFGVSAGESEAIWKRIAVGLSPDGQDDDLIAAHQEQLQEQINELQRIPEEAQRHVYNYSKLRPVSQRMIDRMTEDLLEVERGTLGIHEERNRNGDAAD